MFPPLWLFIGKAVCGERVGKPSVIVAGGRLFRGVAQHVITLFLYFHDSSSLSKRRGLVVYHLCIATFVSITFTT